MEKAICRALLLHCLILQSMNAIYGADKNDELLAKDYDFVIVGGGSAGSVVASRLTEDPTVSVLLLEAGEYPPPDSEIPAKMLMYSKYDWQFEMAPQFNACLSKPNNQCIYSQGKALGGSSTINLMMYIRGNHKDYDDWAAMGNEGWSWKDVLPYFLKSEGNTIKWVENDTIYHNSNGPLTVSEPPFPPSKASKLFLKSVKQHGYKIIDVNGKSQYGFMPMAFTIRNGARCSTFIAYLLPALDRENLRVLTRSYALKIMFDKNKKAVGVTFSRDGTEYNVTANKEVILSAGAMKSPQILMLSGIGPADYLKTFNIPVITNLSGVGSNLQDHVSCKYLSWSTSKLKAPDTTSNASLIKWLYFREGPLTVPFGAEDLGFLSTPINKGSDLPDVQLIFQFLANTSPNKTTSNVMCFPFLLHTKTIGFVGLRSADPLENPIVNIQYLNNEEDMNRMVEATKFCVKLINSSAYEGYNLTFQPETFNVCKKFQPLSDDYLKCILPFTSQPGFHAVGTCKMGPANDNMAVVDPAGLSVYNVTGLRVIDSSVMPQIVSGNTNAPTIMIAEKICDVIKQVWGLK
ncbi:hypothetical protein CHUAL_011842 [Chamberlinius hualienensis]